MTRFDTYQAANYLVWQLQSANIASHITDDGDLIALTLKPKREKLLIYLMERQPTLQDIQHHLQENTKAKTHSLFLFWVDMLLPPDGERYLMPEWLEACAHLYGDKVYGFEVAGREAYFIPVYLRGQGRQRDVRYGSVVKYSALNAQQITTQWHTICGTWRIASFETPAHSATGAQVSKPATPVAAYYQLLGIADGAELDLVKRAYRDLARRYHPDVNPAPAAIQRMKQINDAYQRVLQHLEQK